MFACWMVDAVASSMRSMPVQVWYHHILMSLEDSPGRCA
jgi:hypothetical protein